VSPALGREVDQLRRVRRPRLAACTHETRLSQLPPLRQRASLQSDQPAAIVRPRRQDASTSRRRFKDDHAVREPAPAGEPPDRVATRRRSARRARTAVPEWRPCAAAERGRFRCGRPPRTAAQAGRLGSLSESIR
jgi:hypothetical protein